MVNDDQIINEIVKGWKEARQRVLDSGRFVIESHNGWLVQTWPDGVRIHLKRLPPKHHVPIGTIIKVKKITNKGLD